MLHSNAPVAWSAFKVHVGQWVTNVETIRTVLLGIFAAVDIALHSKIHQTRGSYSEKSERKSGRGAASINADYFFLLQPTTQKPSPRQELTLIG